MTKHRNRPANQQSTDSNSCQEKLSFDDQKQATAAKVVADLQHGAKLKTYKCHSCNLWHLTSNY
jgi:hypothetical protein